MDLDAQALKPETQKSWWCKLQSKAGRPKTQEEPEFPFKSHDSKTKQNKTKQTSKTLSVLAEGSPAEEIPFHLLKTSFLFFSGLQLIGEAHRIGKEALLYCSQIQILVSLRDVLTEIQT